MAMMVLFTIPARFLGSFLVDHVEKDRLHLFLAGTFLFLAAGIIAILLNQSISMVYVFLILFGVSKGASMVPFAAMGGRYFGRKAYGSVLGASVFIASPLGLIAPIYTGWTYDTTGSYIPAFTIFAVLAISAAIIMCLGQAPKLPVHVSIL